MKTAFLNLRSPHFTFGPWCMLFKRTMKQTMCMQPLTLTKMRRLAAALSVFLLVAVFLTFSPRDAQAHRNLLILHSYHQGFLWTDEETAGIFSVFNPKDHSVDIHVEYLDTKHHPDDRYMNLYADLLRYKNIRENKDLVLVCDNNALEFIKKRQRTLFRDLPVVFCGINGFKPENIAGIRHVTGVNEFVDHAGTLNLMLSLHPMAEKILVIVDASSTGKAVEEEIKAQAGGVSRPVTLEYLDDYSFDELPKTISALGPEYLIYFTSINLDKNDTFVCFEKGISLVRDNTAVPIYSSWDHFLGYGIVGGVLTSGYDQGRDAALLAKAVLDGEAAESLPVVMRPPTHVKFDYTFLAKYHIPLSALPENAEIINKPKRFRDEQVRVLMAMVIVLLISALILFWKNRKEKQRAVELQIMNDQLDLNVSEKTRAIKESNEKLRKVIDTIPSPVFIKDLQGVYIGCNKAFSRTILGLAPGEVENKSILDLRDKIPPDLAFIYISKDKELISEPGVQRYESQVLCADGKRRDYFFNKATLATAEGQVSGIVGIMVDISDRKKAEKEREELIRQLHQTNETLERLSVTDALTGLYNRGHITQRINEEVRKAKRYDSRFSILMLDLDHFKSINDSLGHSMGDLALQSAARVLTENIRETDVVARFGGEEFLVLLPNTDLDSAFQLAERIRKSIADMTWKQGTPGITVSGGVVEYCDESSSSLLKRADDLLYWSKAHGRNQMSK